MGAFYFREHVNVYFDYGAWPLLLCCYKCECCYKGPTHRGAKSGCKLVTEFDSYCGGGVSAVIGVQHTEVPNLGASW